jgi:hypothetical protein
MDSLEPRQRRCLAYKRLAILASVFVLTAISALATPASASSPSVRFDATLTGTVTGGGGWCCGTFIDFEGSAVVKGVGAVEFTGHRLSGCLFGFPTMPCFRRLDLMLVARNGDQLVIRGNNEWVFPIDPVPQVTTWSVDKTSSTGRFADFAASGTYTFEFLYPDALVTLSGTMQPAGD